VANGASGLGGALMFAIAILPAALAGLGVQWRKKLFALNCAM
jgi:hypothetical protein